MRWIPTGFEIRCAAISAGDRGSDGDRFRFRVVIMHLFGSSNCQTMPPSLHPIAVTGRGGCRGGCRGR